MIGLSKEIKNILLANTNITNITGNQIYNIINDERAKPPFLVVELKSLLPEYTKEWDNFDNGSFNIVCIDSKYDTIIDLASKIRDKFEFKNYTVNNYQIDSFQFNGFIEDFNNELYTGIVSFTCKVFKI